MAERRRYTKRQKATTVLAAEISSVAAAAEAGGIPETTVRYWMDLPEFVALRAKTREELGEEAKVIAHQALAMIRSKLDSFEPRDLTILFGVLADKSQLLTGQATARTESRDVTDGLDDHERAALRDAIDAALHAASEGAAEHPA